MKKIFLLTTYYLLLTTFSGCGYTTRSNLAPYIKTVYIENFENKIEFSNSNSEYSTYFPGLENDVTEGIEERFALEGSLKVVDDRDKADIILKGDLVDYVKQPLRYEDDEVEEYRLSVAIKVQAVDLKQDAVIWKGKIIGDTTYFVRGSLSKSETEAVDEAIEDLARRVVEKTMVRW